MYKNQTAPDSGGSPPTSTNSDVAVADKEGVPLDEAVGKLLEGMDHLGNTRAHRLDVARTVGPCSVRLKTMICCYKLVGLLYLWAPKRCIFLLYGSYAADCEPVETRSHPHSVYKIHFNTLRTGSFKLFKRPFPGFLTILTL